MKKLLLSALILLSCTAYSQLLQEGFEGTWPPTGWTIYNVSGNAQMWGQSQLAEASQAPYEGNYAAYLDRENVTAGATEDWLVTPYVTIPDDGVLSFYSKTTIAGEQNTWYEVWVNTTNDPSALGVYQLVHEWTETSLTPTEGEYHHNLVYFPEEYYGQQVHIAFVMKGDQGDRWLLDNVSMSSMCATPTNLMATNITPTSAMLQWDSNDATQWEIAFQPEDQPFTGQGVVVDQNFYQVTNIVPGSYEFYVRAICENGVPSVWAGPYSFSTVENTGNTVTGIVQYDNDGDMNCTGGIAIPFLPIDVTINNDYSYVAYTNEDGEYTLHNLPSGSNTILLQVNAPNGFDEAAPVTQVVEFDSETTEETINVCLAQPDQIDDLSVTFIPTSAARPGFDATYMLAVSNNGTTTIDNAIVSINFDTNRLNFVSSDMASTVSGSTITLNLNDLMPYETEQAMFTFYVLPPEINIGGEILQYTVGLSIIEADATPNDNSAVLNQIIVNSFDPNDITVHEGEQIYEEQADDYLTYTIRFQNTGTAEAINVKLENELDAMFDFSTFQPIAGSHEFTATLTNGIVVFNFDEINLPDSTSDEPASHGFVTYRIKPTNEFGLNDIVSNQASIYFDFNPAIATNTVATTVIAEAGIAGNAMANVVLYPNPVKDQLSIILKEGSLVSASVIDMNGRTVTTVSGYINTINTGNLATGMYFVKVTTDRGASTYKIIKQ